MSHIIDDSLRRPLTNGTLLYNGRPNGTYKVVDTLGIGGFGVTYKAHHLVLDQYVAIKEYMPQGLAMRNPENNNISNGSQKRFQDGLETFLDEARTLAKLRQNPGIVTVLDFFEENGTAYFVMEFYEGQSLNAYISKKGGKIPVEEAFEMLNPVFDALRECHTAKDNRKAILHRDIKPDNIYVTHEGRVLLLDFGAAKQVTNRLTSTFSEIVSPHYSPPEQYSRTGQQGPWSDIYATAATFYRTIMGKDIPEALDRYQNEDLNHNYPTDPETSAVLKKVLSRALALKIADRTQTMETFQVPLYDHFVQKHLSTLVPQEPAIAPVVVVSEEKVPVAEISAAQKLQEALAQTPKEAVEREFIPQAFTQQNQQKGKELFSRPPITIEEVPTHRDFGRPSLSERAARIADEMDKNGEQLVPKSLNEDKGRDALPDHLEVKPSKKTSSWGEVAQAKKIEPAKGEIFPSDLPKAAFDEPFEVPIPVKEVSPKKANVEKPKIEKPTFGKSKAMPLTAAPVVTQNLPEAKPKERFAASIDGETYTEGFTPNWRIIVPVLLVALAGIIFFLTRSSNPTETSPANTVNATSLLDKPFAGQVWTSPLGIKMVWIEGGNNLPMGDDQDDLTDNPAHKVNLNGYWMSQTEVTQAQYEKVMGTNPSQFKGENLPVEQVSQIDAVNFVNKLRQLEKQPAYNLPSEAQWEYAAQQTSAVDAQAWFATNSQQKTQIVGQLEKNTLGIFDLLGNVKEWCLDNYSSAAYTQRQGDNPVFKASNGQAVMRGGAYNEESEYLNAKARDYAAQSEKHSSIGIRLVMNP